MSPLLALLLLALLAALPFAVLVFTATRVARGPVDAPAAWLAS